MNHPERLADYLGHINEAIDDAISFLADFGSVAAFEQDRRSQYAVIRAIEIIGEAASRIRNMAPEFVAEHPEIPWDVMRGMRNKMIHEYADIDLDVVFHTVKNDLPPLQEQLIPLLAQQAELHERLAREKAHIEAQERQHGQEPEQEQEYSR